jgi:hypothetical protein
MTRFASVVTRDVSESGVYLDCRGADAIPLYRLVYLQLERGTREVSGLPPALRDGRVLSAVYRVGPCEPTTGTPSGYALRLLVEPGRRTDAPCTLVDHPLHFPPPIPYEAETLRLAVGAGTSGEGSSGDADLRPAADSLLV